MLEAACGIPPREDPRVGNIGLGARLPLAPGEANEEPDGETRLVRSGVAAPADGLIMLLLEPVTHHGTVRGSKRFYLLLYNGYKTKQKAVFWGDLFLHLVVKKLIPAQVKT